MNRSGRTLAQASIAATLVLQGKTYLYVSANPENEHRFNALVDRIVAERRAAIDAARIAHALADVPPAIDPWDDDRNTRTR